MPKIISSEAMIKFAINIPVSPNTEIIENDFGSDGCSFNAKKMPKRSRHNKVTNHKISNFETFDLCTSPFEWNVIENDIKPKTRETM